MGGSTGTRKALPLQCPPSILSYATDGTYARAMQSEEDMLSFVDDLTRRFEQAADMAW